MEQTPLGKCLQKQRLKAGLSLEEAAAGAGISVNALQLYEQGVRIPRDEVRLCLAFLYKADKQEFYD